MAQVLSLQPEESLEKKHSANKCSNNAVSSTYEFRARLDRIGIFVVSFKATTGDKEPNSREKEEARSYYKIMQSTIIPVINVRAELVSVVVLEEDEREREYRESSNVICLHDAYQSNCGCDAWEYTCIEKNGGCNDQTGAGRVIHMENLNNPPTQAH